MCLVYTGSNFNSLLTNIASLDLHKLADAWVTDFCAVAALAEVPLSASDVQIMVHQAPHHPPVKPKDCAAVYVFLLGDKCLKVGKAGPKSGARYSTQHYTGSAKSTLAGSLSTHSKPGVPVVELGLARDWICKNTSRVNLLIGVDHGPFVIALLETFLQCRLQPVFEGVESQRIAPRQ